MPFSTPQFGPPSPLFQLFNLFQGFQGHLPEKSERERKRSIVYVIQLVVMAHPPTFTFKYQIDLGEYIIFGTPYRYSRWIQLTSDGRMVMLINFGQEIEFYFSVKGDGKGERRNGPEGRCRTKVGLVRRSWTGVWSVFSKNLIGGG